MPGEIRHLLFKPFIDRSSQYHIMLPATMPMSNNDAKSLDRLNSRLDTLVNIAKSADRAKWQRNFTRSMAELKREQRVVLASPRSPTIMDASKNVKTMALKNTICTALSRVQTSLNCSAPVTPIAQKVCPAIAKSKLALGCNGPMGCTIDEDCGPTAWCSAGSCLPKSPKGTPCATGAECLPGLICNYATATCDDPSGFAFKKPSGEPCVDPSECRSNQCNSNYCY